MPTKHPAGVPSSEITPHATYLRRRELMAGGAATLVTGMIAGAGVTAGLAGLARHSQAATGATSLPAVAKSKYVLDEKLTKLEDITTYNNFYEFGTDKGDPARHAGALRTRPWTVTCEGELKKPQCWTSTPS